MVQEVRLVLVGQAVPVQVRLHVREVVVQQAQTLLVVAEVAEREVRGMVEVPSARPAVLVELVCDQWARRFR